MAEMRLGDVVEKMRDIDFTTLFTRSEGGALAGRSMSHTGDEEDDGSSFLFAQDEARAVSEIDGVLVL